jgi:hypothetical protein
VIYVQTTIYGSDEFIVSGFTDRADLIRYAQEVTACFGDVSVYRSDTITAALEKLDDAGPGRGSRCHRRILTADDSRLKPSFFD